MSRTQRQESSTQMYHVVCRSVNCERIFESSTEKKRIRTILKDRLKDNKVEIYAYCIMPTHLHLMLRGQLSEVSGFMARTEQIYAVIYNQNNHRNGHLFQNRFYSDRVEDETYFWNCLSYIHNNPVKAQMVDDISDYEWSSYKEYRKEKTSLLNKKAIEMVKSRFEQPEQFKEFTQTNQQETWYKGTAEEIAQQHKDLINASIDKLDDISHLYNKYGRPKRCEFTSQLAKKFNIKETEVLEILATRDVCF